MAAQVVVEGTLRPDGTLDLDTQVPLPAGRVLVTVQPAVQPRPDDPFWQRMQALWDAQKAGGRAPRGVAEVEAERRTLREEVEEEIQHALRLQEECRRAREQAEGQQAAQ